MRFSFSDADSISGTTIAKDIKKLQTYREKIETILSTRNAAKPEYALHYCSEPALHETLDSVTKKYAKSPIGFGDTSFWYSKIS